MFSNQKSEYTDNNIIYNIIDKYIIQPFKYYGKDFLNHPDEKDIESNSDNQKMDGMYCEFCGKFSNE